MPNRLSGALSPYLLQHAGNPVDWQPWDAAARERAVVERKPIFLSIGYSSCHWCHVMAHDSFEDARIAALLNERFVPIKVDREERPDLDQLYMEAVQAMTGQGGWPLSVFLTPRLEPFFGGTFWPARARGGMPGFDEVLEAVSAAWNDQREAIERHAAQLARLLAENQPDADAPPGAARGGLDEQPIAEAVESLGALFDARHGGFGGAPKFPQPALVRLLLRRWRRTGDGALREMATTTLDRMAAGGMYDQIGGGFHRYAVDAAWLVPHFEKMLYDNAQLALLYVEAWQATGREPYRRVAAETLDYLLADMRLPGGAFASGEDADSEGEEGRFYLWTPGEIAEVLAPDAAATFCRAYDISEPGNFERRNIPRLARPVDVTARMLGRPADVLEAELAESRRRLRVARAARVRPARDDKVIVAWNALAIEALAAASVALGVPAYAQAASEAARFVLDALRGADGRLLHSWRGAPADVSGFLDDYAAMVVALEALWRATGDLRWLAAAEALAGEMLARFAGADGGALYYAAEDHEPLVARKKDLLDNALPSGNTLAATGLARLGRATGRKDLVETAGRILAALAEAARRYATGAGQWFVALDEYLAAGEPTSASEP